MYDELNLFDDLSSLIKTNIPQIKHVKPFSKFYDMKIKGNEFHLFIDEIDVQRVGLNNAFETTALFHVHIGNKELGDSSLKKLGRILMDGASSIKNEKVKNVYIKNPTPVEFDRTKNTWYRIFKATIRWGQ